MARKAKKGKSTPWLGAGLIAVLALLLIVSIGLRYGGRLGELLSRESSPDPSRASAEAPASQGEPSAVDSSIELRPISLQILNAAGKNRLALETGERLRKWGVDAIDRANAPPWPFPETLFIVRGGDRAEIVRLADRLGGIPVILQRREDLMLDATLILGHDWERYNWPSP